MKYEIEIQKIHGRLLASSDSLQDAINYANSFKETEGIRYIEVTSIDNNEVLLKIEGK